MSGATDPTAPVELAAQLYAVWVRNGADPLATPDWESLEGTIKAQWRAQAEVYARLELYSIDAAVQQRVGVEVARVLNEVLDAVEIMETQGNKERRDHMSNPTGLSDHVWSAELSRRLGAVDAYRRVQEFIEKMLGRAQG